MSYIEKVNQVQETCAKRDLVPPEVFSFALSLKQPEALARRMTPDAFSSLSASARQFEKARTIGNASVRLAVASYWAAQQDSSVTALHDLMPDAREDVLDSLCGTIMPSVTDEDISRQLFLTKRGMKSRTDRLRAFGSYVNFLPGSYSPTLSGLGPHDSLLVQAFGRNEIIDADLITEIVQKRATLGSDEAMFSHLQGNGFDEGESNRALADAAVDVLQDPNSIIEHAWQWEVSYSVWSRYPELFDRFKLGIHTLWPKSNFYPTYEVKADSKEVMRQYSLYNPMELAHPDMTIRALAILAKLGIEADAIPATIPFDSASAQAQTRSAGEWVKRESLTRVHHILANKVRF